MKATALSKPVIMADGLLAEITGKPEGTMLSYLDLTAGLHRYVRQHNLTQTVNAYICRTCGASLARSDRFCFRCGGKR